MSSEERIIHLDEQLRYFNKNNIFNKIKVRIKIKIQD